MRKLYARLSSILGWRMWMVVACGLLIASAVSLWPRQVETPKVRPEPLPSSSAITADPSPVLPPLESSSSPTIEPLVAACRQQAKIPFVPTQVQLLGVSTYGTIQLPITDGKLPVPPDEDVTRFAVVRGDRAADDRSMVRITAHTWQDHPAALGNVVNDKLVIGAIIVLHGDKSSQTACYRVSFRDTVNLSNGYDTKAKEELDRYNGTNPKDDLGIMVCAGRRVGPGDYTHRLNIFATRYK